MPDFCQEEIEHCDLTCFMRCGRQKPQIKTRKRFVSKTYELAHNEMDRSAPLGRKGEAGLSARLAALRSTAALAVSKDFVHSFKARSRYLFRESLSFNGRTLEDVQAEKLKPSKVLRDHALMSRE